MKKFTLSQKLEILEKVRKQSFKNYEGRVKEKDGQEAENLIEQI